MSTLTPYFERYYYLISVGMIAPLWLFIFIRLKKSRTEIIYLGLIMGNTAMLVDYYCSFYDYWHPPLVFRQFNIESYLYGFVVTGIAAKIYELVFRREFSSRTTPKPVVIAGMAGVYFLAYTAVLLVFPINSVMILDLLMLATFLVFVWLDRRALKIGLVSGVLMVVINVVWYAALLALYPKAILNIWVLANLSGIQILGLPIEEHLFIFLLGAAASVGYKVLAGVPLTATGTETKTNGDNNQKPSLKVPLVINLFVFAYIAVLGHAGRITIPPYIYGFFHKLVKGLGL